jgi:hypothetical protein
MTLLINTSRYISYLLVLSCLFAAGKVAAADNVNLRLSVGNSFQTRNDVQVPNTDLGTRFSLGNIVGEGPLTAARLEVRWAINERHGVRVLLAPLSYTKSVILPEPVLFEGGSFSQDQATDATYKFNSWRVGYFYSLVRKSAVNLRVGATLKVRDAEIRLAQGDTVSAKPNLGLVPLLYVAGTYQLNNKWTFGADLDGLAGGPGRAIDAGVSLDYSIAKRWTLGAELRILDGGAEVDEVYNFARFNSASVAISTRF